MYHLSAEVCESVKLGRAWRTQVCVLLRLLWRSQHGHINILRGKGLSGEDGCMVSITTEGNTGKQ